MQATHHRTVIGSKNQDHEEGVDEKEAQADLRKALAESRWLLRLDYPLGLFPFLPPRCGVSDDEPGNRCHEYKDREQAPTLRQNELVADVLIRAETNNQAKQPEGKRTRDEPLLQRFGENGIRFLWLNIDYRFHVLKPFRLQAGPEYRMAGRSAQSPGSKTPQHPCSRWKNTLTTTPR